jgi:threonine dehydrogenase-like Zn-dependent dehydrogenase
MRAAVFAGRRTSRLERTAAPQPGPREVVVRLQGCGVCASSLPVWEGRPWFSYPLEPGAPGHEGWGVVEEVGELVESFAGGERVALLSERAFAELDVADESALVRLPPELDGVPFPGEALGCTFNVLCRSDVRPDQRVAVVGVGFLGTVCALLAERAGAEVVKVRRGTRIKGLEESCERVIETAGTQASLDVASRLVTTRGRLVIAGYHQDGPRQVDLQSWNWRGLDVVNAHERDPRVYVAGIRAAVDAAADGRLDVERLITHRLPLARLGDAFELARTRPAGFLKAVVEP